MWQDVVDWFYPDKSDNLIHGWVYVVETLMPETKTLHLVGFYSPGTDYWCPGYKIRAFRPAVEKKTDISIFTVILHKATKRQDA